jgi:uncharacterized protein
MRLLTPEQRRHLVVTAPSAPAEAPWAPVVRRARAIIEAQAGGLAKLFDLGLAEAPDDRILTALIKPVGDACNLRCRYCFNHPNQRRELMPDEVLEAVIRGVLQACPAGANISFHGGEPLLGGLDFFRRAMEFQAKWQQPGQFIRNSVQTNGTLLDADWAVFLAEHGFSVSVSVDGPPAVHDANRIDAQGRGSMDRLLAGLEALRAEGICAGAIAVITSPPAVPPAELLDFLHSIGVEGWRANPCRATETNEGYGAYVGELFDAWVERGGEARIAVINETLRVLLGYAPTTCSRAGTCSQFIGFEPDGSVWPCCEMTLEPRFCLGNVLEDPLDAILEGPVARTFRSERDRGHEACGDCEWWDFCHGGCTYHRLQAEGSPAGKDYLCQAYMDAFEQITNRVDALLCQVGSVAVTA